uniref:EGF-like domain-containing protein n=1 Tax=Strongyloides papillosus TaxID=174720 RepID=A0A0N5BCI9_STREA
MAKLSYIYLTFIIHACILFGLITSLDLLRAEDYHLEYWRYSGDDYSYWFHFVGERQNNMNFKVDGYNLTKPLILYRLHVKRDFLIDRKYDGEMRIFLKNIPANKYETNKLKPKEYILRNGEKVYQYDALSCNLYKCRIGAFYYCSYGTYILFPFCKNAPEAKDFIYMGFTKSHEYDNLVLKLIPKSNTNKNIFSIAVCPGPSWLPQSSNSEYIPTWENNVTTLEFKNPSRVYFLKYAYCHNIGSKTFVKCGKLKQMFMPSIDVGYQCDDYNNEKANFIHNHKEKTSVASLSGNKLICKDTMLYESKLGVIAFLPPGNQYHKIDEFSIEKLVNQTNLYAGHRLHILNTQDFFDLGSNIESSFGYIMNYEAKCSVPTISATLRLKIDDNVQGFDSKIDQKFGRKDIYTLFSGEIKKASIGCHIVLDEMKYRTFKDFYGLRYSTSLTMFDETTEKYITVDGVKNLVSNRIYKCILITKGNNSKIKKPDYIKETEFIIVLTGEYFYWIIFGVFILITALLIAGLVIYKKLQLKKRKTDISLSTSSSMSSSQSTSKSSTVVSEVSNVPIIQNKNVATKSRKMS